MVKGQKSEIIFFFLARHLLKTVAFLFVLVNQA